MTIGWLILRENDVIRVFHTPGTPSDAEPIDAMTVYILNPVLKTFS